jgi:hypothetical protein
MRHRTERHQDAAERTLKDIRRKTRKRYSSEEKIRIVLAGLRGEDSIAELCRQEGMLVLILTMLAGLFLFIGIETRQKSLETLASGI